MAAWFVKIKDKRVPPHFLPLFCSLFPATLIPIPFPDAFCSQALFFRFIFSFFLLSTHLPYFCPLYPIAFFCLFLSPFASVYVCLSQTLLSFCLRLCVSVYPAPYFTARFSSCCPAPGSLLNKEPPGGTLLARKPMPCAQSAGSLHKTLVAIYKFLEICCQRAPVRRIPQDAAGK